MSTKLWITFHPFPLAASLIVGFGIPRTFDRPNRPPEVRLVDLLAGMVKHGLAGT